MVEELFPGLGLVKNAGLVLLKNQVRAAHTFLDLRRDLKVSVVHIVNRTWNPVV